MPSLIIYAVVAFLATAMFQGPPPGFPGGPPVGHSLPNPQSSPSDRSPCRPGHSIPNQGQQPLALPAPPPSSAHQIVAERLAAAAAIASTSRRSPINTGRSSVEQGSDPSFLRSGGSPSGRRAMSSPIPGIGVGVRRETRSEGSNHSTPSPTHHHKNLLDSIALSLNHQVWTSCSNFLLITF